jgi:hypothetical protein
VTAYATRLRTMGPPTGAGNICGSHGKLTVDHIAPKGCAKLGAVTMSHIVELLGDRQLGTAVPGIRSSNGPRFARFVLGATTYSWERRTTPS